MKQLAKTIESKVKIRFPDCDPFNHLNNSKYIDYIINTREDQLLEFYAQNQIAYLAPATLMETVTIQTQLIFCNEKALILDALMWNEDKTVLKAVLWTKLIHYNLMTKKSVIHSEELMRFFKQVENPLNEKISFEKRVENLRFSNAYK